MSFGLTSLYGHTLSGVLSWWLLSHLQGVLLNTSLWGGLVFLLSLGLLLQSLPPGGLSIKYPGGIGTSK